ncbi:MAG TPA: hypothetical protein VN704_11985 [Verrucomicrobiae bacterium]|nr:hypothetical protein [Verrucomicrobiae bacterium]
MKLDLLLQEKSHITERVQFEFLSLFPKNCLQHYPYISKEYIPLQFSNNQIQNNIAAKEASPTDLEELREIDKKILLLFASDPLSIFSFKAIERRLDLHQQSITRSLKRLLELDLLEKTSLGYKLFKENNILTNPLLENNDRFEEEKELFKRKNKRKFTQLMQIRIPLKNNIESIVNHLIGKWIGELRWDGLVTKETGVTLRWIAFDKQNNNKIFHFNVNIVSEYIVIESDVDSDKNRIDAIGYSNRIIREVIKVLQTKVKEEEGLIATIPKYISYPQKNRK